MPLKLALRTLAACLLMSLSWTVASAQAGPERPVAQDAAVPDARLEELRGNLIETLDSMRQLSRFSAFSSEIQMQILQTEEQVRAASAQELMVLDEEVGPSLLRLRDLVLQLRGIADARSNAAAAPKSLGFPNASYPDVDSVFGLGSGDLDDESRDEEDYSDGDVNDEDDEWSVLCSGSTRSDDEAFFIAYNTVQIAKLLWQVVGRACNQVVIVVVIGGGGGNCSLCCAVADVVFTLAESIFNSIELCDGMIDSAEIEGSYERLAHVHGDLDTANAAILNVDSDLASHATAITSLVTTQHAALTSQIDSHDTNIEAALAAHDLNIDTDLQAHDADVKALLGGIGFTLDNKLELRTVHMQVFEVTNRARYLVTTAEGGLRVEAIFESIQVFNDRTNAFENLDRATTTEIEPGIYALDLRLRPGSPDKIFRVRVRHDDVVDHFGEIIFNRGGG